MNLGIQIVTFLSALVLIWTGAGFIVNAVEKIATQFKASAFVVSFFVLGLMTSLPETSIGLNAVRDNEPEIFIGALLGGTVVIFLLIIPIFGILGKGLKLSHDLGDRNLILALTYILLPILLLVDGNATIYDGIILILFYLCILVAVYRKRGHKEEILSHFHKKESLNLVKELAFIVVGLGLILLSSNFLVNGIEFFAERFGLSELVLSLIILSIGTNIPELSLAIRGAYKGGKDIALGNYLGSAVANGLIMGLLILLNGGALISVNLVGILISIIGGIGLFYIFARSKDYLSRTESLILLFGYFAFVIYEVVFKLS